MALATVFAGSFVIRHSTFVTHVTFCSFPGTSSVEHLRENGADGISDVEGKVARVAMSELGSERVSMELMGSAIPQPRDRKGSGRAERERARYNGVVG